MKNGRTSICVMKFLRFGSIDTYARKNIRKKSHCRRFAVKSVSEYERCSSNAKPVSVRCVSRRYLGWIDSHFCANTIDNNTLSEQLQSAIGQKTMTRSWISQTQTHFRMNADEQKRKGKVVGSGSVSLAEILLFHHPHEWAGEWECTVCVRTM